MEMVKFQKVGANWPLKHIIQNTDRNTKDKLEITIIHTDMVERTNGNSDDYNGSMNCQKFSHF